METQPIAGSDGKFTTQQVLASLLTHRVEERLVPTAADALSLHYIAIKDGFLLGSVYNGAAGSTEAFVIAEASSYREIKRVPFAAKRVSGPAKREVGPIVSGDRNTFVYFYDNQIVYRRTSDLGIIWSCQVEPP